MMEEASVAAVNGELSPFASGVTACRMISACRDLSDYRRASEWIEATERYCKRQSLSGSRACAGSTAPRSRRSAGRGSRPSRTSSAATVELERFRATPPQADGYYAIGEIRRLRATSRAPRRPCARRTRAAARPSPALALIRLAQGKVKAAATAIEAALAEASAGIAGPGRGSCRRRSRSWSRPATSRRRAGRRRRAVRRSSRGYPSPALEAGRHATRGRVLLAEGDAAGAARGARARRTRAGGRSGRRTRWRGRGRCWPGAAALGDDDGARPGAAGRARGVPAARRDGWTSTAAERDARGRRGPADGPRAGARGVHVHRHRRLHDTSRRRSATRPGSGSCAGTTTRSGALVAAGGGEIVNSTGDGFFAAFESARRAVDARDRDPARPARAPGRDRVRAAGPDRAAHRRGEPARRRLQRHRRPRRGPGRCARGGGEILATVETLAEAGERRDGRSADRADPRDHPADRDRRDRRLGLSLRRPASTPRTRRSRRRRCRAARRAAGSRACGSSR